MMIMPPKSRLHYHNYICLFAYNKLRRGEICVAKLISPVKSKYLGSYFVFLPEVGILMYLPRAY